MSGDSRYVQSGYVWDATHDQGSYLIMSYYTQVAGNAYARHQGHNMNVLWVDGHVNAVPSQYPNDPGGMYYDKALPSAIWYADPANVWNR